MKIKKTIYTCLMLLTGIGASAQNNINQYMQESQIMGIAIDCLDYDKYINQDFMPVIAMLSTDEGMAWFIDPVSYGQTTSHLWEFKLDPTKSMNQRVYADVFKCEFDVSSGTWTKGEIVTTIKNQNIKDLNRPIRNRIEYIIDNSIIMEKYQPEKKYYKTRGNNFVRIEQEGGNYKVYGSWQHNLNAPSICDSPVEMENGLYLPLTNPVMQTNMNVAKTLASHPEFSEFFEIVKACGAVSGNNEKDNWTAVASGEGLGNLFNIKTYGDVGAEDKPAGSATLKATYLLNNYHYTVYAPTNAAMEEAFAMGLPTIADLEAAEAYDAEQAELELESDSAARIKEAMLDFVKYHIHDNSVYVDGGSSPASYESAKTELIASTTVAENVTEEKLADYEGKIKSKTKNEDGTYNVIYYTGKYSPGRPYKLHVNATASGLTVTDNIGNTHNVVMTEGLYNIPATEYWVKGTLTAASTPYNFQLDNSSSVVIHAIDGPLVYADGEHFDAEGNKVPTQFVYKYKPLTSE